MNRMINPRKAPCFFTFMNYLFILGCLLIPAPGLTAQVKANKKIHVRADYMRYDLNSGDNLYKGNIQIEQGTLKLTGDSVIVSRKNNEISHIKITGNPASYTQDENTANVVRATSKIINYDAKKNRLELMQDANLEQAKNNMQSQRIVYDTLNKTVIAGDKKIKEQDPDERVIITLTPEKKNENKNQ